MALRRPLHKALSCGRAARTKATDDKTEHDDKQSGREQPFWIAI
jgi:hypothetical protein